MAVIRLSGFAGENRAVDPKLLPETAGTVSLNQKPGRGDLRPWKSPLTVASATSGHKTIYRMGRDTPSDTQYWQSWNSVVHAVRGFDAADTTEQTFFTGDGAPKVMNNTSPQPFNAYTRPLGLSAPTSAPIIGAPSGGSTEAATEEYYYVYTFVSDWGWESAPSPPSAASSRKTDATVSISGFATVPVGNYQVNRIRIYRTQGGSSGTEFFFLREVAYGTATTVDDNRDLGETLETATWLPAPGIATGGGTSVTEPTLSNLTTLWNGMLAGISGNGVRFCEAYVPYAWPAGYNVLPPDSKAVALGVFGQTLLVLTTGRPLVVAGSGPDAMDQQPLEMSQGCVAPRSVVSMGSGVAWASEDGLCWYGAGGARILTAGSMSREDWQLLNPSSIVGCMYEGLYFGSYLPAGDSVRRGFIVDPSNPAGIYFLDAGFEAMHFDELRDQLYVLDGGSVKKWDAGTAGTCRFRSKEFWTPSPMCFTAAEVVASAYPVTFRLIAAGATKHTQTVLNSRPFRLPSGFRSQSWQIELEGSSPVQSAAIATSVQELAQV